LYSEDQWFECRAKRRQSLISCGSFQLP
jgi:hypothetical protein